MKPSKKLVLFALGLFICSAGAAADFSAPVPATIPFTQTYDFTSKINGAVYRIWITSPAKIDPSAAYPALYVFDGNQIAGAVGYGAQFLGGTGIVAVSIGYPGDLDEWRVRRFLDLTSSSDPRAPANREMGGSDVFVRILNEEIRPFVASRFKLDPDRQAIAGHSLGGLTAMRILLHSPQSFSSYCISSPSIWWNDREILAEEKQLGRPVREGSLKLRILISSAGEEQPVGNTQRMIDNASEFATRLGAINPANLAVTRVIFADETHESVASASVVRCLRFAVAKN
jgi:predicted alpha/beta superfamily hydrolase